MAAGDARCSCGWIFMGVLVVGWSEQLTSEGKAPCQVIMPQHHDQLRATANDGTLGRTIRRFWEHVVPKCEQWPYVVL